MKVKKKVAVFFRRGARVYPHDRLIFAVCQAAGYKIAVRDICPKRSPTEAVEVCEYKWFDELEKMEA